MLTDVEREQLEDLIKELEAKNQWAKLRVLAETTGDVWESMVRVFLKQRAALNTRGEV